MLNVLVTGATGFIGRTLVDILVQQKINVRALLRNKNKSQLLPKEVEYFIGDLTDPKSLDGACRNIDTVFHLGGYAHDLQSQPQNVIAKHEDINYRGTQNILEEALAQHVHHFIFLSSVKAVADQEDCINEQHQMWPDSPYGLSKRKAEELLLSASAKQKLHVCILRPPLVYGPACKGNLESMLRAIEKGLFLPLPKINNRRSMVSVIDICCAAILAATHPKANGKIYFVTDGKNYSTRQLYELMCDALNKTIPQWSVPMPILKCLAYFGDFAGKILRRQIPFNSGTLQKLFGNAEYDARQIQKDLNFIPRDDFEKMLPAIVAAYKKNYSEAS